jgi:hypothetical protein
VVDVHREPCALSAPDGGHCAVVADIPQAKNAPLPYAIDDAKAKTAAYEYASRVVGYVTGGVFALFIVIWAASFCAFEEGAEFPAAVRWLLAGFAGVAVVGLSLVSADVCIGEPWRAFAKAQQYYAWYHDLPRLNGALVPLSQQEFAILAAGPPHPSATQFALEPYLWVTLMPTAFWLFFMFPQFIIGAYWIAVPLPLAQAYRRARRDGRELTAEEILAATHKAIAGKSAWKLRIMERKARRFAAKFGHVSRNDPYA